MQARVGPDVLIAPSVCTASQPRHEQLALENHFFRDEWVDFHKQLILQQHLTPPFFGIDALQPLELRGRKSWQIAQVKILRPRHPAEWCFARAHTPVAPIDDPFEDAHILTESGPKKFASSNGSSI